MAAPANPRVYHIIHVDRLSSVIADGHLWCDEVMVGRQDAEQAEFLVEKSVPWELIARIGVRTPAIRLQVEQALRDAAYRPIVEVLPGWCY
jgi:hypothetical protein